MAIQQDEYTESLQPGDFGTAGTTATAAKAPDLSVLLAELGGDNPRNRVIAEGLNKQGIASVKDIGVKTDMRPAGDFVDPDTGERSTYSAPTQVFYNKANNQPINPERIGIMQNGQYGLKGGDIFFHLNADQNGNVSFDPQWSPRAHGFLRDSPVGQAIMTLGKVIPSPLQPFFAAAGAADALAHGNYGGALASVLPYGVNQLVQGTDLLTNLRGSDFNPLSATSAGNIAEALGVPGQYADIAGKIGSSELTNAIKGGPLGLGALNAAVGSGVQSGIGALGGIGNQISNMFTPGASIGNISEDELNSLYGSQSPTGPGSVSPDLSLLTPEQLQALYNIENPGGGLTIDDLVRKATDEAEANTDPYNTLKPGDETNNILSTLTSADLAALTSSAPEALASSDLSAVTSNPYDSLDTSQVNTLDTSQIGAASTGLTTLATSDATLNTSQISGLSTSQLSGLTSNQIAGLLTGAVTGSVVKAVTGGSGGGGTTTQIPAASTSLTALTSTQVPAATTGSTALTSDQISALTTTEARGLQALGTSQDRYWRQTGAQGTGGKGGVKFFEWYDTPENRTMAPATMAPTTIPAITSQQAQAMTTPAPKQYFNQATNRYYTDTTGNWTPPAGWTQTGLKDGGEVKTQHFDGGGSIFDFDTGVDFGGNTDYLNLMNNSGVDLNTALNSANSVLDAVGYAPLGDLTGGADAKAAEDAAKEADAQNVKNITAANAATDSGSVLDKLIKLAKDNPNLAKALAAAGLGAALGYAGRPKPVNPMGMQGGSLGLTQAQVHGALKGVPVKRAGGGGIGDLGGYAGGGGLHYLKSAEDGMADKIPATIDNKQPAKLSGGEFVIPADVVSHLGNGNSEAGAKQLYDMMDRIRHARTGTKKQGKQINPAKFTPK